MSGDPMDDDLESILGVGLEQAASEIQSRQAAPYDGVLGELPPWFPDNFQREFHAVRCRLLATYSHGDLLDFLAEVRGMLDPSNPDDPAYSRPRTPFNIMREVSALVQFHEAVQLGPDKGLALLTDPQHAGRVKKGDNYSEHQSRIAGNKRGRVGDDGETIGEIIGRLALTNQEETAKGLWRGLFSELDRLGLNPVEEEPGGDVLKWHYLYDFKGRRKPISFGQFAKVVSRNRHQKLP